MKTDNLTTDLALNEAIDALYDTFYSYPLRHPVSGCSCCVTLADQHQLAATPLRALKAEELDRYSFKAMTTWGDVDDFKHFLPRLLEISYRDPTSARLSFDPVLLFGKVAVANWWEWPEAERQAVELFVHRLWRHILLSYPYHISTVDFIQGMSQIEDDLGPFLDSWLATDGSSATKHLVDLINYCHAWPLGVVLNGKAPERQAQQILELFLDATLKGKLEAEFFENPDEEQRREISMAVELLESLGEVLPK